MMVIIASVSPTVATASAPSRPTKKTSTTANTDSSASSRTIGTASSRIARPIGPSVYSPCVPRSASRIVVQALSGSALRRPGAASVFSVIAIETRDVFPETCSIITSMSSLCALLGIEHPILQSGMGRVAGPELAAEVSKAGGLGILAGLNLAPDDLRAQIRRVRALTPAPFGVNLWLHPDVARPIDPASLPARDVAAANDALNPARRQVGVPES